MANAAIDKSLNDHLGLPDGYKLGKIEAFKLYSELNKMLPNGNPITYYNLFYYVDRYGDFINEPKSKKDYTVKAIFDNMDKSDQFSVLTYINDHLEENSN